MLNTFGDDASFVRLDTDLFDRSRAKLHGTTRPSGIMTTTTTTKTPFEYFVYFYQLNAIRALKKWPINAFENDCQMLMRGLWPNEGTVRDENRLEN